MIWENLIKLYIPLILWVGLGLVLGRSLPLTIPLQLGRVLFWVGVPLSILAFMRQADLSASVWVAPAVAWAAILLGAGFAWVWLKRQRIYPNFALNFGLAQRPTYPKAIESHALDRRSTQGSFLLATMVGNTGYLGYPVSLALAGTQYFGWAVFYDTLGSTLGAYGLGVMLAARFGSSAPSGRDVVAALLKNPALWSFWFGLATRSVRLPDPMEQGLRGLGWSIVALSLLLIGMRLSRLTAWHNVPAAAISLGIKMILVPLLLGFALPWFGITGMPQLVIVLQMAMPPAFATLVIAEAYDLDRDLAVTTLAIGAIVLLVMLPVWLWLFGI